MVATAVHEKALEVNLDEARYGTFAEIGAGQEVARWFFRVGGAAGTIAKSMSAYDMRVSDAIYGEASRYVSRERLEAMLVYEHQLNLDRLGSARGAETAFFAFADTVAARSYGGASECHGWMGIRFQDRPGAGDSQIVLHVRMLDPDAVQQQEALGHVGVNLVYGAFYLSGEPERLLGSLLDGLSISRIEIDMIELSGEAFEGVDNRVMTLELVRLGLTPAGMFSSTGQSLLVSDVLYGKPVLVQRGRFRPPTLVNKDMQRGGLESFRAQPEVGDAPIVSLLEMTMRDLSVGGEFQRDDFLDRLELLESVDFAVLISNYFRHFELVEYLTRSTRKPIGIALGIPNVRAIFDDVHYQDLAGGSLEAIGRLFKDQIKLLVYPALDPDGGALVTADDLHIDSDLDIVYRYLLSQGNIKPIASFQKQLLSIYSDDVIELLRSGDPAWEAMVDAPIVAGIKSRGLFGYRG